MKAWEIIATKWINRKQHDRINNMKIYISGQITGLFIEEAKKQFKEAEVFLKEKGHEVINPFNIIPDNPNPKWEDYMLADIKELFACEAIYLLSNWHLSKGARIEKKIAEELHLKIFFPGIGKETGIDKENIITKETIDRAMRATERMNDRINTIPKKDYLDTENDIIDIAGNHYNKGGVFIPYHKDSV